MVNINTHRLLSITLYFSDTQPVISYSSPTQFPRGTRPLCSCNYCWHVGNHHTAASAPFQVRSHSLSHHRSQPLSQHCMGHIVHPLHTHCYEEWGPVKGLLWKSDLHRCRICQQPMSHTHLKWAEKKNGSILLQYAESSKNKPAVFAGLSEIPCGVNTCVCVSGVPLEDYSRPVFSQGPKDWPNFVSSRHDKAECLWLYLNPTLSLDLILIVHRQSRTSQLGGVVASCESQRE